MGDTEPNQNVNYQIPPPAKFSFKADEWIKWIKRFDRFRIATGLDKKEPETQVNTFIYSMGEEAEDIFVSFELSADEAKQYDVVRNKFENHFIPKRNVIFERAKFYMRSQNTDEPVDNFITDLYCLAEHCSFGTLKDEMIRDKIVVGIKDKALSQKLQLDAELTLEKAVTRVRQYEKVKKEQSILSEASGSNKPTIENINKSKSHRPSKPSQKPKLKQKDSTCAKVCPRCLGDMHPKKNCPAVFKNSKCAKCSKTGHWARACKSVNVNEVAPSDLDFFMGEVIDIETVHSCTVGSWKAKVGVQGKEISFKIDTGADVTVLSPKIYMKLSSAPKLRPTKKILRGPCKQKLVCKGVFTAQLETNEIAVSEEVYVLQDLEHPLLSKTAAEKLKLIKRVEGINKQSVKDGVMNEFPELFKGLGKMKTEYTITLQEKARPFAIPVPRRVPIPLYEETKRELERMLNKGVISKVDSPTEWCAPMVVTPKGNTGKVRVCVDLTQLNKYVQRENHPLPAVDTTLARLAGAQKFSKLDANSGFWQIKLAEKSRPLTTFITPWGRFMFNVLPYGISSGSEKFQKSMSEVLQGLEGVECSIDDVLVHGKNQAQHDERLIAVLKRVSEAGMTLNQDKCVFDVAEVKFLGHVINTRGIQPDPEKLKAIADLPPPTSVSEVRTFLGMINQLSKFAEHLANKSKPIRDLLIKNNAWIWGAEQERAFDEIKRSLMQSPVLAKYDPNKETKISADASSLDLVQWCFSWRKTSPGNLYLLFQER